MSHTFTHTLRPLSLLPRARRSAQKQILCYIIHLAQRQIIGCTCLSMLWTHPFFFFFLENCGFYFLFFLCLCHACQCTAATRSYQTSNAPFLDVDVKIKTRKLKKKITNLSFATVQKWFDSFRCSVNWPVESLFYFFDCCYFVGLWLPICVCKETCGKKV